MVKWTSEQRAAIERDETNVLVAAAAGSGKTAVLVERIIEKLTREIEPYNIDEILVATFTNAAAEEMRTRIGIALENEINNQPNSYHLKKQLALLQRAHISTLHSFCTQLVRQYSYLIDVDPSFRIADEMEIELIKMEILEDLFEFWYAKDGEEAEKFYRVIDTFSSDRSDEQVGQLILSIYTFAMQHPQPEKWLHSLKSTYAIDKGVEEDAILWLNMLKNEVAEQLNMFIEDAQQALRIAQETDGPYTYIDALEEDITLLKEALQRKDHWDDLQQFIANVSFSQLSRKKMECNEDKREKVKEIRKNYRDTFNKMKKEWFIRDLESHLEDMERLAPLVDELVKLVLQFKETFTKVKKEKAIVDFTDLEHFSLNILIEKFHEDNFIISPVALQYKKQFKEILVDEYQDINLVQETILRAISDEDGQGNMFMVGDVKQSIYRFRHAEPTLFIQKYKTYENDDEKGIRIDLAKNFRSRKEILSSTNFVFKQILDISLGEIEYDDKASLVYGNLSYEETSSTQMDTELLIIDRDDKNSSSEEMFEHVESWRLEARLYAQKIKEWIGVGNKTPFQIVDKETGKQRPVKYSDIVILLSSLTNASTIVDEFKKQGIPVHAELKTGYFEAIEIQIMINLLKIIDNPYQDIPLVSVLKSPMYQFNEDELTKIRLANTKGSYIESIRTYCSNNNDVLSERLSSFLHDMNTFRLYAKENSLSELIWYLYRETGYYDFVSGIPGGRQRQANLRALFDRAKSYEETSFRGLFRFLRFIERMEEENKDMGEARALSDQEDVVRIMTIHRSKGLEFPIVILGGMNKQFNMSDISGSVILDKDQGFAMKYIDPIKRISYPTLYYLSLKEYTRRKMLAEQMRVLYVAMTRAKEKLLLVGNVLSAEKSFHKWQEAISEPKLLLPNKIRLSAKSFLDLVAPTVLRHRHSSEQLNLEEGHYENLSLYHDESTWKLGVVKADQLTAAEHEIEFVKEELQHMIQEWEITDDLSDHHTEKIDKLFSYSYPYEDAAFHRAKQSVSEIKRKNETADEYSDYQFIKPIRTNISTRPRFLQTESKLTKAEIGTAMHAVMQHLPFDKQYSQEEVQLFVHRLVEEEKLTPSEANVISYDKIARFFETDLAKHMIEHHSLLQREVPFTFAMNPQEVYADWKNEDNEQIMIQGVIDCLIHHKNKIIIVDYKTDTISTAVNDETINQLQEKYKTQISLYEKAVSTILNETKVESYLYFFDKNLLIPMNHDN